MKKILSFFPMTRECCAIARHSAMLNNYEIAFCFMPEYLNMQNKDINIIDNGLDSNIYLSNYSKDILKNCDILYLDYDEKIQPLSLYQSVITDASEQGIHIVYSQKIKGELQNKKVECPNNKIYYQSSKADELLQMPVPVITILTQGENTDQYFIELFIRRYFNDEGYKISQVSTSSASNFFGFDEIPKWMHETRDIYEKTMMFNQYLYNLVKKEILIY